MENFTTESICHIPTLENARLVHQLPHFDTDNKVFPVSDPRVQHIFFCSVNTLVGELPKTTQFLLASFVIYLLSD